MTQGSAPLRSSMQRRQPGHIPGAGRAYPLWSYQVAIDLDHFAAVVDDVQQQSAAAVAPLTDHPQPPTTSPAAQRPSATALPQATDQKVRPGTQAVTSVRTLPSGQDR